MDVERRVQSIGIVANVAQSSIYKRRRLCYSAGQLRTLIPWASKLCLNASFNQHSPVIQS